MQKMIDNYTNKQIRNAMCAAAKADCIMTDDESLRCYEYNDNWGDNIQMAKYSSGGGDDLILIFKDDSMIIKGFDHESDISPHAQDEYGIYPGIYDSVPDTLLNELRHEKIDFEEVTFCLWRDSNEGKFSKGEVDLKDKDDGSEWLVSSIITNIDGFLEYVEDYYEDDLTEDMEIHLKSLFN